MSRAAMAKAEKLIATGQQGLLRGFGYMLGHGRNAARIMATHGPNQIQFWLLALLVGLGAGAAAIGFRLGIGTLQRLFYGADDVHLASVARDLPWWWLMLVPIACGLIVGLLMERFSEDARVRSVSDVIEGAALEGGRVEIRAGLASALASTLTLGMGGSAGREGPVVHLAAVMSSWLSSRIQASPLTGRELLGCAVAGAVAASFNAPIAGALFAHEVILRHFAQRAFAPIAISAVTGTIVNRLSFGGAIEFDLPRAPDLAFYVELPALMLLGVVSALAAVALIWSVIKAEQVGQWAITRSGWPRWLRPVIAGALLGALAIPFPHIIGVGYETTWGALTGGMGLWQVITFAILKVLAVAITLGGRLGGGIFSPALVLGALTGLAFGIIATSIFPEVSGTATLYAMAGMAAVAAAVLGAPISTAMILFEMTGDWQTGIAVMTSVALSSALASRMVHRSFFLTILARRGTHIAEGPQVWLPEQMRITTLIRDMEDDDAPAPDMARMLVRSGRALPGNVTLAEALEAFEAGGAYLPVIGPIRPAEPREDLIGPLPLPEPEILGVLHHVDALRALNQALSQAAAEEHG